MAYAGPELLNLHDVAAAARERLHSDVWDWVDAGAMDEQTTRRNRTAFADLTLRPRYLRDVRRRDLTTTVLGAEISLPVMLSPAGLHGNVVAEGERATTRGAGRSGTLLMVPAAASYTLEEVAATADGPLWFQLSHFGVTPTRALVERAETAGYRAIVLTVDTPLPNPRERDRRNGYLAAYASDVGKANFRDLPPHSGADGVGESALSPTATFTWPDIAWLRSVTSLPLVVKGLTTEEDARLAVEHGADAIFVSNHGGRLMDGTLSAVESLPEVVDAVAGRAEVYLDSGIRRGSDVLKALALGARAVAVGRPLFWGLAVAGEDGVHLVLELLRHELDLAVGYCGQTSIRDLEPGLVELPASWTGRTRR